MDEYEAAVTRHYGAPGVEDRLVQAAASLGLDPDNLAWQDLAAADELHVGGVPASLQLAEAAGIGPGTVVLDIGSGIGGPARAFAGQFGARVMGIDLTPEFVDAAAALSRRCGFEDQVQFAVANALEMPFADSSFDAATMLHAGMNIPQKQRLFTEVARVLTDGASFAVYDIMAGPAGDPAYPLPWATAPDHSFVSSPDEYLAAGLAAGFQAGSSTDLSAAAIEFMERGRSALENPPAMGLHLILGPGATERMANLVAGFRSGALQAVQIIFTLRPQRTSG